MNVDRLDEPALELQRQVPDEALQHGAHVVAAQEEIPQNADEALADLRLLELPGDRLGAVGHEQVAQRFRVGGEVLLQDVELGVEQLVLRFVPGFGNDDVHRTISPSQLAATLASRALSCGVTSIFSSAPGMVRATCLTSPSTTMRVNSNSSGTSW